MFQAALSPCNGSDIRQRWIYNATRGTLATEQAFAEQPSCLGEGGRRLNSTEFVGTLWRKGWQLLSLPDSLCVTVPCLFVLLVQ